MLARIAACALLLAGAVPLHLLLTLLGRRDVVPPRFLGAIGRMVGLRIRVAGRAAYASLLLVANHTSWLDILALASASRAGFVARGDLADHPVLKWLCEQNGTVFVARERRGSVDSQVEQLCSALRHRRMVIFPEGTTGDGTHLLPFKSALFSVAEQDTPPIAVQPVALAYAEPTGIAWHGREPGLANALRVLARVRPVALTVHFLAPIEPRQHIGRKALAAASQAAISAQLGL